jgi:hypothetical protein
MRTGALAGLRAQQIRADVGVAVVSTDKVVGAANEGKVFLTDVVQGV